MNSRVAVLGFAAALALAASAGYAQQEFTLDHARARIEQLEGRLATIEQLVASQQATMASQQAAMVSLQATMVPLQATAAAGPPAPLTHEIVIDLELAGHQKGADECQFEGQSPRQILILNGSGDIIGVAEGAGDTHFFGNPPGVTCTFYWSARGVPDSSVYEIKVTEIFNQMYGGIYSYEQLDRADWRVALSSGD
jgi:hypothetical protein